MADTGGKFTLQISAFPEVEADMSMHMGPAPPAIGTATMFFAGDPSENIPLYMGAGADVIADGDFMLYIDAIEGGGGNGMQGTATLSLKGMNRTPFVESTTLNILGPETVETTESATLIIDAGDWIVSSGNLNAFVDGATPSSGITPSAAPLFLRSAYQTCAPIPQGPELITNGTFATDSDWTKSNATIAGGEAYSDGGGTASITSQSDDLDAGVTYDVSLDIVDLGGDLGDGYLDIIVGSTTEHTIVGDGALGVQAFQITPAETGALKISGQVASDSWIIDDVSVKTAAAEAPCGATLYIEKDFDIGQHTSLQIHSNEVSVDSFPMSISGQYIHTDQISLNISAPTAEGLTLFNRGYSE